MNRKTASHGGRVYMNINLDPEVSKQIRHFLVDEFGNIQALSLLIEHYIKRGMEQDASDLDSKAKTLAVINEAMEERKAFRVANMAAGREARREI